MIKITKLLFAMAFLFLSFMTVLVPIIQEYHGAQASPAMVIYPDPEFYQATPGAKLGDYYLAYPGILPDHPLYWVKMIRDRIVLTLTAEPVARWQLLLLYADKRIGAAQVLVKGNKVSLGAVTATKAEKYMDQALGQLEKLKSQGKMTAMIADQAIKACAKHQEITSQLVNISNQEKDLLSQALEISQNNLKRALQIVGR